MSDSKTQSGSAGGGLPGRIVRSILPASIAGVGAALVKAGGHHIEPEHVTGVLSALGMLGAAAAHGGEHAIYHLGGHEVVGTIFGHDEGKPTASGLNHDLERALSRAAARTILILYGEWRNLASVQHASAAVKMVPEELVNSCAGFLAGAENAELPDVLAEWLRELGDTNFFDKPELGAVPWNLAATTEAPPQGSSFAEWFQWRYPATFRVEFAEELINDDDARNKFQHVVNQRVLDLQSQTVTELAGIKADLAALAENLTRIDSKWLASLAGQAVAEMRRLFPELADLVVSKLDPKFAAVLTTLDEHAAASEARDTTTHQMLGVVISKLDTPPAATSLADAQLLAVFACYRSGVATDTKVTNVVTDGLAVEESFTTKPLRLRKVYVALDTAPPVRRPDSGSEPMENRTLTAWEALTDQEQRLSVFIGEPGSGKSTFIQYATLELAETQNAVVPFRILLRKFADFLAEEKRAGCSEDVIAYIERPLLADSQLAAAGQLRELLTRGLAAVFFDGLDEVPGPHVAAVRGAITGFALRGFARCRIAATCRVASYEKEGSEFRLPGFPEPHKIRDLSPELRNGFIRAWYGELRERGHITAAEAGELATSLQHAIRASDDLREMAGNPFFLSAMCALHSKPGTKLPDSAAALMDLLVSGTLDQSRKTRDGGTPIVADKDALRALRRSLQRLAYDSRKTRTDRNDRESTVLDIARLKTELAPFVGNDTAAAERLIEDLRHRAGILHSTDGKQFSFAYRFEEFLAGCHLTNDEVDWPAEHSDFSNRAVALWRAQRDYALKPIVWAAGFSAHVMTSSRKDIGVLIKALLDAAPGHADSDLEGLDLAADIGRDSHIAEWKFPPANAVPTLNELRTRLAAIRSGDFPSKVRSRAASALGRLGDLPDGAGCRDGLPWFAWSPEIPAGDFVMGGQAGEEERMRTIAAPYRIAKFPVTVAQFAAFIAAGGYENYSWWSQEGARWRREKRITGPDDYDPIYQTPNHPRVGVSWFEAEAFCGWLNSLLKVTLGIRDDETIRLATEAEWERAARGAERRSWPWVGGGSETDLTERCNSGHTRIGNTSAVGLFPTGNTPEGIADMSGNVWEWCEDWYDDDKDSRVVRGGSFSNVEVSLSPAGRGVVVPSLRYRDCGFRVVVVCSSSARSVASR